MRVLQAAPAAYPYTPQKGREQRTWKKRLLSGTLRELAVAKHRRSVPDSPP